TGHDAVLLGGSRVAAIVGVVERPGQLVPVLLRQLVHAVDRPLDVVGGFFQDLSPGLPLVLPKGQGLLEDRLRCCCPPLPLLLLPAPNASGLSSMSWVNWS